MVIFHSYVNVYQRVLLKKNHWTMDQFVYCIDSMTKYLDNLSINIQTEPA